MGNYFSRLSLKNYKFIQYFFMFFSSTLIAQLISLLTAPILTRLYTPEDFGVYNYYLAIISLLLIIVTGRYEFALNTAKNAEIPILMFIIKKLTIYLSFVFWIITIALYSINIVSEKILVVSIPISLVIMGLLQGNNYFLNRIQNFKVLSKSKIVQSIINGFTSISFGLINFGLGLIVSNIIALLTSLIYQIMNSNSRKIKLKINSRKMMYVLKKYSNLPKFNLPSAFFDMLAIQAPIIVFMKVFNESIVGYFSLSTKIIGVPLGIISTSISQVFLSEVSRLHREEKPYYNIIIKVSLILVGIAIVPFAILVIFSPKIFSYLFGEGWYTAGVYTQILCIGYFFRFIVQPLGIVFYINNKIQLLFVIQIVRFITTSISLLIGILYFDFHMTLLLYSIHEAIYYVVIYYIILKTSRR